MNEPLPLIMTAANGHNWLTFEAYDTPQWFKAVEWLKRQGYETSGESVIGLDEAILPSYVKAGVSIATGFDNWSGNYLLAECDEGDQVILSIAAYVSANDRRAA